MAVTVLVSTTMKSDNLGNEIYTAQKMADESNVRVIRVLTKWPFSLIIRLHLSQTDNVRFK